MDGLLFEIAIAIIVAAIFGILAKVLRQPLMLAYIIAGVALGPIGFSIITNKEAISTLSTLGIAFLLFLVGIDLDIRKVKQLGKATLLLSFLQLFFTGIFGYGLAILLGFNSVHAFYICFALAFSSTIIGIKLISEKKALESLYGRLTIGLLIIQDIIAIFLLIIIKSINISGEVISSIAITFLSGILFIIALFIISKFVIIPLFKYLGHSAELLFLSSVAWCLAVATSAYAIGFSIEIGAFLAGLILSFLPAHFEISNKVRSLRDFFLTIFFISLGAEITLLSLQDNILPILVFSILVMFGIPVIMFIALTRMGYSSRTSFMAGITAGQISEFSLILITLGIKNGSLESEIISMMSVIAIITIGFSTFFVTHSEKIYFKLSPFLKKFEKKIRHQDETGYSKNSLANHYVIFGADRTGGAIVNYLKNTNQPLIVVDFDPELIKNLAAQKIPCVFGDAANSEVDDKINLDQAKVVISTVPNKEINQAILQRLKEKNLKPVIILTATQSLDARDFYNAGADYVIVPHLLGGKYVTELLQKYQGNLRNISSQKEKNIKELSLNGNGHTT